MLLASGPSGLYNRLSCNRTVPEGVCRACDCGPGLRWPRCLGVMRHCCRAQDDKKHGLADPSHIARQVRRTRLVASHQVRSSRRSWLARLDARIVPWLAANQSVLGRAIGICRCHRQNSSNAAKVWQLNHSIAQTVGRSPQLNGCHALFELWSRALEQSGCTAPWVCGVL
jgi:hypothetical protein